MQNVNVSYINTYPAPDWPRVRRAAFNWSLLGFFVLDLVLLFWLLNPFAAQSAQHRVFTNQAQAAVTYESDATGDKPSPLGPVVAHRAKAAVKTQASLR
jgi:membrane protein required for beta-lactamase induction